MTSTASYPINLGATLNRKGGKDRGPKGSRATFASIKYNFKPPSIGHSSPAFLHSPSGQDTQWVLEYDTRDSSDDQEQGSRSSAHGFKGSQSAAKDVECVLQWDEVSQSYILDRLSSSFSFKYDRGHHKLSEQARRGLSSYTSESLNPKSSRQPLSALGLELTGVDETSTDHSPDNEEDVQMGDKDHNDDDNDDDDNFARQLELNLQSYTGDENGENHNASQSSLATGLGLSHGLREDIITPQGSPYIDRPKSHTQMSKSEMSPHAGNLGLSGRSMQSGSPSHGSPRAALTEAAPGSSSAWRPPPQRSSIAIAYDEDEEVEGEEDSEEEEDDDEEEEDEGDEDDLDGDLDDYARQLENSLQG